MKESIQEVVERKNKFLESREGYSLHVAERLITIDGVDGAGKETMADVLLRKMMEKFGNDAVIKIDITHFVGSDLETTEIGNRVHGKKGHAGYFKERTILV